MIDFSKPLQYALGTMCEPDWVDCDFVGKTEEHVVIAYRHGKVEIVRTMEAHLADELLRNPVRKRTGYVVVYWDADCTFMNADEDVYESREDAVLVCKQIMETRKVIGVSYYPIEMEY